MHIALQNDMSVVAERKKWGVGTDQNPYFII